MTERIKELAELATCDIKDIFGHWIGREFDIEKFAELVAADEREACAQVAELAEPYSAADLIRKRGQA